MQYNMQKHEEDSGLKIFQLVKVQDWRMTPNNDSPDLYHWNRMPCGLDKPSSLLCNLVVLETGHVLNKQYQNS